MGLATGYAFKCAADEWRKAKPDDWEIVTTDAAPRAKFLGFRVIDDTRCTVWETRGGVFAQTESTAKPPKGMR